MHWNAEWFFIIIQKIISIMDTKLEAFKSLSIYGLVRFLYGFMNSSSNHIVGWFFSIMLFMLIFVSYENIFCDSRNAEQSFMLH